MKYWTLENGDSLAFTPRNGSTAFAQALLDKFHHDKKLRQESAFTPENVTKAAPQFFLPSTDIPTGTCYIVVRDPIERFRSGFSRAAKGRSVDDLITALETGTDYPVNVHIAPQVARISEALNRRDGQTLLYSFPNHLAALATILGLDTTPLENASEPKDKPTLTKSQITRLKAYYAEDAALFDSILASGQELVSASLQVPAPIYVPQSITAWQATAALKLTPFGNATLYEAVTATLAGMPDGADKIVAQTAFEKDAKFLRNSPTIAAIANGLGLDSVAVDGLFILGDSLEV